MAQYQLSYAGAVSGNASYSKVAQPQIFPQPSPLEMLAGYANSALQTAGHYLGNNSLANVVRYSANRMGELGDYLTSYVSYAQGLAGNILLSKRGGAKAGREDRKRSERTAARGAEKNKQLKPGGNSRYAKKQGEPLPPKIREAYDGNKPAVEARRQEEERERIREEERLRSQAERERYQRMRWY